MNSANRISGRLPSFYRSWDKNSTIFRIVNATSGEIDSSRQLILEMMRSHWVDSASDGDLDRISQLFNLKRIVGEDDEHFRARLKGAVIDFTGGGTLASINSMLKTLIGDDISVVENPPTESYFEVRVMSGDSWSFGNNSVEEASIPEIIIEAEDVIENPQILNEDFEQALGYNGVLNKGDKLVIKDGRFLLNGEDVSERVSPKVLPKIHRRVSSWKYVELIREKIGVFDSTTFDESIFAVNVPKAKISMKWVRYQPATFSVKLNRDSLNRSKVPKEYVEEVLNSIKAAGVKVIVEEVGE